jgi:flavin-dependent dehydrogenase
MSAEVAIVGGGIAGSSLAIALAKRGRRVTLIERDTFPRDKLCGELLSTEVRSELSALGVDARVLSEQPAEIRRARFVSASGRKLELDLGGVAFGLSRGVLDALLFDEARRAGASVSEGVEALSISEHASHVRIVTTAGELEAPIAVLAHGRRTKLDKALDRPFTRDRHPYAAIKRHYRPRGQVFGLEGFVELHTFAGGYCGFCFVEGGVINACALVDHRRGDVRAIARASPSLERRFAELEPIAGSEQAIAEIPFAMKETHRGRVFYAGDAAGMIAPLAGDGQAMALASARKLAALLRETPSDREISALGAAWDRAWRAEFGLRVRVGRILQSILLRPTATDAAIRALDFLPALAPRLVRITRG